MTIYSFPPLTGFEARVLVLGSMPGKASLRAQQYYAHPRNLFWKLSAEVLGFALPEAYDQRLAALRSHGVVLWDVLQSCSRESSQDSDIDAATAVPNDFATFFAAHPNIRRVCFNGAAAGALYARHVRPELPALAVEYRQLPSSSPANASVPWADKLRAWQALRY